MTSTLEPAAPSDDARPSRMRLPLWLKVGWTLWVAVWATCYWKAYGPQNFLWFCCLANFGIAAGLWLESPLLLSWQAVSVLGIDFLWAIDYGGALATGRHYVGGTEYMFDASNPLPLRLLSLYHIIHPPILLGTIARLCYHPRGWLGQCATAWAVLPVCLLFDPALDINWVWGPFDQRQHVVPPIAWLGVCMAGFPLLFYLPTHLVLARWFARRRAEGEATIPVRANLALTAALVLSGAVLFAVLPLCLLPRNPWWALLLVPLVALANTHWALIHEAVHGHLYPNPAINVGAGRLLSIFFGGPFSTLRAGHLLHHRFNGTLVDRPEVYARRPHRARYYFQLVIGLHLLQAFTSLAVLLPASASERLLRSFVPGDAPEAKEYRDAFHSQRATAPGPWNSRLDGLLVIALFASGFVAYGKFWPLLLLALLGRGFLVSFMDNSYHYGLPLYDPLGARNARAGWSRFWLHFNLHGAHHRNPQVPWSHLPALLRSEGLTYDMDLVPMALQQLRGPIPADRLPDRRAEIPPARRSETFSADPASS